MGREGQNFNDPTGEQELEKYIFDRSYKNDDISMEELTEKCTELAIKRKRKHGLLVDPALDSLHDDTVRQFIKRKRIKLR